MPRIFLAPESGPAELVELTWGPIWPKYGTITLTKADIEACKVNKDAFFRLRDLEFEFLEMYTEARDRLMGFK